MTCCNNVQITRQDAAGCGCIFRCNDDEYGARILGAAVTIDAAPSTPADFIPGTPVVSRDGVEYTVMAVADLIDPTVVSFGFVTCGAVVSPYTVYPFTFKPEIVRSGSYYIGKVAWPVEFTAADIAAAVAKLRTVDLEGFNAYA